MKFLIILFTLILLCCSSRTRIKIKQVGIQHIYPQNSGPMFGIDFNITTKQANYVWYINTGITKQGPRINWKDDPYSLPNLKYNEFIQPYDRSHLVAFADYGNDTMILSNAVPMLNTFNRGTWANIENNLRHNYYILGKQIIKGCDYTVRDTRTNLYILLGCYYIVKNTHGMGVSGPIDILDYGYYLNTVNSRKKYKFPFWIEILN